MDALSPDAPHRDNRFSTPHGLASGMPAAGLPVMDLLALHWTQVLDYAALCTATPRAARALALAAFRRGLEGIGRVCPTYPWRRHLLGAVLETAEVWSTDERRSGLLQEDLRTLIDGWKSPATALRHDRRILLRALQQLTEQQQVLLWHTEVEAEDLATAGSLAGLDPEDARSKAGQARLRLRGECRQVHLDLAPHACCRRYNRLIDVATRHGHGATELDLDLRQHLAECPYCQASADQLAQPPERLPLLLAEATLAFRAEDYLAVCRARARAPGSVRRLPMTGRPAMARERPARGARRRGSGPSHRRSIQFNILLVSTVAVLAGVLAGVVMVRVITKDAAGGTGDAGLAPPGTAAGAGLAPGSDPTATESPEASVPPAVPVVRLRNAGTGLCLDVDGQDISAGAAAVVSACGTSPTQLWRLENGGLLRSHAAPLLCLDSAEAFGLEVRPCAEASRDRAPDFRFRLTDSGLLVPLRSTHLAMAPVHTRCPDDAPIVLKGLDASDMVQHWRTEQPATMPPAGLGSPGCEP